MILRMNCLEQMKKDLSAEIIILNTEIARNAVKQYDFKSENSGKKAVSLWKGLLSKILK